MTHVARELGISIDRVFDWVVQACHDPRQLHEGTLSKTVQAELVRPCGLTTACACARSRLCVTPSASSSARPPPTDGAGGDRDARYWRPGRPGGSPHGTAVRGRHPLGVMQAGCHPRDSPGRGSTHGTTASGASWPKTRAGWPWTRWACPSRTAMPAAGAPTAVTAFMPTSSRTACAAAGVASPGYPGCGRAAPCRPPIWSVVPPRQRDFPHQSRLGGRHRRHPNR